MKNFGNAITYSLVLVGGVFAVTIILATTVFEENPIIPASVAIVGLAGYLIYKTNKK
jgi:hypothetical protein